MDSEVLSGNKRPPEEEEPHAKAPGRKVEPQRHRGTEKAKENTEEE
jgi:hypothetical protein